MSEERNLSEIIIELEKKIDDCLKGIQNQSLINSTLIGRLDQLLAQLKAPVKVDPVKKQMPAVTSEVRPPGRPKKNEALKPVVAKSPEPEVVEMVKSPEPEVKKMKNVFVRQQVVYENDSPVRLAKVAVVNSEGKQIGDTMTDNVGKWKMNLAPGKYHAVILRKALPEIRLPEINKRINFEVPDQSEPLVLETVK